MADFTARLERSSWATASEGSCSRPRSGTLRPSTSQATPCSHADPRRRPRAARSPSSRGAKLLARLTFQPPRPTATATRPRSIPAGPRIAGALGGRAAEEVVYGRRATGAETRAWNTPARSPAKWWAAGGCRQPSGPFRCSPRRAQETFLAWTAWRPPTKDCWSNAEARRIVEECYGQAMATLRDNRDRLERLARHLFRAGEALDEYQAYAPQVSLARGSQPRSPPPNCDVLSEVTSEYGDQHGHGTDGDSFSSPELLLSQQSSVIRCIIMLRTPHMPSQLGAARACHGSWAKESKCDGRGSDGSWRARGASRSWTRRAPPQPLSPQSRSGAGSSPRAAGSGCEHHQEITEEADIRLRVCSTHHFEEQ